MDLFSKVENLNEIVNISFIINIKQFYVKIENEKTKHWILIDGIKDIKKYQIGVSLYQTALCEITDQKVY